MRKVGEFGAGAITAFCLAAALCAQQSSQPSSAGTSAPTDTAKPASGANKGTSQSKDQAGSQSTPGSQTGTQPGITSTIRVPVNLVNVLFTVTDKKNRMVIDLTQNDFRVLEDSKPQNISFFSRESDLPLRVGILIDTSNSIRERLQFEEEAAVDFLAETLRPDKDQAFAVAFDVEPQLLQDYTDDVEKLAAAIRGLQSGGGTGLFDAMYFAAKEKMQFVASEPYLRRVMIILSDGLDNESQHTRDEALSMAQRAEVTIFAISTNRSGTSTRGDRVLKYVAEQTGGRAFFPFEASDLAENFREISHELRTQYSLAYVSTNQNHDGTFRSITLETLEKGYHVRAKRGYFARAQ
jgi:Ca-activated chloride channel homolog